MPLAGDTPGLGLSPGHREAAQFELHFMPSGLRKAGAVGLKHKEQRTVQNLQGLQNAVKERILSELSQCELVLCLVLH